MTLKQAFTKYLSEELNYYWKETTGEEYSQILVATDYMLIDNSYAFLDQNGNEILDSHDNNIKYIPCGILSFIGERRNIPNIFIEDITIPLELQVNVDYVPQMLAMLEKMQDELNAKIITLKADYKGIETDYKLNLTFNIPDSDTFNLMAGNNAKMIDFQISGVAIIDMFFGNDIIYELSLDGVHYEKVNKLQPNIAMANATYDNQKSGSEEVTSLPRAKAKTMSFSCILKKNSILFPLLYLTQENCEDIGISKANDYVNKAYLKTVYAFCDNMATITPIQSKILEIGSIQFRKNDYIQFNNNNVYNKDFKLYNNAKGVEKFPCIECKENGQIFLIYDTQGTRAKIRDVNGFVNSFETEYAIFDKETLRLYNKIDSVGFDSILGTYNYQFTVCYRNYTIIPVLFTELSYTGNIGEIMSLDITLKKKMEI